MQMQLAGHSNEGDSLVIRIHQGAVGFAYVTRAADGSYTCNTTQCLHKKEANEDYECEHVPFARQQYDNVIAPSEEAIALRERQRAEEKIAKARAEIEELEKKIPRTTETTPMDLKRRIIIVDEDQE